jgi:hypothetical protein
MSGNLTPDLVLRTIDRYDKFGSRRHMFSERSPILGLNPKYLLKGLSAPTTFRPTLVLSYKRRKSLRKPSQSLLRH